MNKKENKKQAGFTVLELVAVSGIMVILLVSFFANFRGFDQQIVLENDAQRIVSILRQAQIMALTGQTVGGKRYNYGVHLSECSVNECKYTLFRVADAQDKLYAKGESMAGGEHSLSDKIYIHQLSPTSGSDLDIVFVAPLGEIYFNNATTDDEAQIILKHNSTEETQTISINRISGQVDVNE